MLNGSNIQVGAGRYTQCHGALAKIGEEAAYWGKRVYIVTDDTVWEKTGPVVEKSLREAGIAYHKNAFNGPSTQRSFDLIAKEALAFGADLLIGLGGGRVIDIAKGASDVADRRVITAPTSAATCAAWAILYVTYGEDGSVACSQFLKHEISAVIVDLDFATGDCPVRYLASGIADAMAKKPEFRFTMLRLGNEGETATSQVATGIADYTWAVYLKKSLQALRDAQEGRDTELLEDIVCTNIMLTGMISDLSTGGKQLAIAHNFYDAVCCLRPDVRANFLHGEIVGLAIPLQMHVNGAPESEIVEARDLLREMGIPITLSQAGIDCGESSIRELAEYICRKTVEDDQELLRKILDGFHVLL